MEVQEGFEPSDVLPSAVFRTAVISHSTTTPIIYNLERAEGVEPSSRKSEVLHSTIKLYPHMEHKTGIEPAIFALQKRCITVMLQVHSYSFNFRLKKLN